MADARPPARRMSREALERIIQRAAELQAGEIDTGEGVTEQELLKLGAEVGIDGRFLRQAMYEEKTGPGAAAEAGVLAKWFGPGAVHASRVVQGERAAIETALEQWMTESELLSVKRRLADRTLFERQKGFFAEMKRGFGVGGRAYQLAKAREVAVGVSALESGYCHVELMADITTQRQGIVGGTAAVSSIGAAGAVLASALSAPVVVPVFLCVVFGTGAYGLSRAHRPVVDNTQLALEQVLDRLERGEIKPRHQIEPQPILALGRVVEEIRKAIKP